MESNIVWLLVVIAFLLGIILPSAWRLMAQKAAKLVVPNDEERNTSTLGKQAKIILTLVFLFVISIAIWVAKYYVQVRLKIPFLTEVLSAVFSVTSAAFLGGVVFELLLRKEILSEVSQTLAEIITTDRKVVKELFNSEKRNKVIETMLQVQLNNDIYGSAIYSDLLSHYLSPGNRNQQFRYNFSDHVTLSRIDQSEKDLYKKYYEIIDQIQVKTLLPNYQTFIFGCARDEKGLYSFFNESSCIYRWLLKDDSFEKLINSGYGFDAKFKLNGSPCEQNGQGKFSDRGYEIEFLNPFYRNSGEGKEDLVEISFEIYTLQLMSSKTVSVHLAYPVKGVEISLDYENTNIQEVTALHFMTAGENKPKVSKGVNPKFSKKKRIVSITISNDHWLFPDSGVVFTW